MRSVTPNYLISSIKKNNIKANLIETARQINEKMEDIVIEKIKNYISNTDGKEVTICITGLSFKRNCGDTRNSKILNIATKLSLEEEIKIYVEDYLVDSSEKMRFNRIDELKDHYCNIIIIGANHEIYSQRDIEFYERRLKFNKGLIIDLDNGIQASNTNSKLEYWSI